MRSLSFTLAGASLAISTGAGFADLIGLTMEPLVVDDCSMIEIYAQFDSPEHELLAVMNSVIILSGAPHWVQDDSVGGSWMPVATSAECDSFVTIGGEPGPANLTVPDPGFANPPITGTLVGGWFNPNPAVNQGQVDATGRVRIARLAIDFETATDATLFVEQLSVVYREDGVTEQASATGSLGFYPLCPPSPPDGPRTLILLDRTGSMDAIRPATGNTLCFDAFEFTQSEVLAVQALNLFDPGYENGEVAIWTFNGSAYDILTNFADPANADDALDTLDPEGCTGPTPLAESVCGAIEFLESCIINGTHPTELLIVTDGFENNSNGPCAGPSSVAGPPAYDPGSWQQLVRDTVLASGVPVTTFLWEPEPFPLAGGGTIEEDMIFFSELADASGGYFVFIPFDAPPPSLKGACCLHDGTCMEETSLIECINADGIFQGLSSPCTQCIPSCPADLNGDEKINGGDLGLLLAAWGGGDLAADLNGDGLIDGIDLGLLLAAWGECP